MFYGNQIFSQMKLSGKKFEKQGQQCKICTLMSNQDSYLFSTRVGVAQNILLHPWDYKCLSLQQVALRTCLRWSNFIFLLDFPYLVPVILSASLTRRQIYHRELFVSIRYYYSLYFSASSFEPGFHQLITASQCCIYF